MITALTILSYILLLLYIILNLYNFYKKNIKKFIIFAIFIFIIIVAESIPNLFFAMMFDNIIYLQIKELFLKYFPYYIF